MTHKPWIIFFTAVPWVWQAKLHVAKHTVLTRYVIIHADKLQVLQARKLLRLYTYICLLSCEPDPVRQIEREGRTWWPGILPPAVLPDTFPLLWTGLWPHKTSTYYWLIPLLLDPSEYSHVQRPVSLHHHTANMRNLIRGGGGELTSSFITTNKSKLRRRLLYLAITHPWMT